MGLSTVPLTELEAVNICLHYIGEQPVNSLQEGLSEASELRKKLHEVSRNTQLKGWTFNTDYGVTLSPNTSSEIEIPTNALVITHHETTKGYVERARKVYNSFEHTFTFTADVTVDIIRFLAFEDLPSAVREFITIAAARAAQATFMTSETAYSLSALDEERALTNMQATQLKNSKYNSLTDNFSTASVLGRNANTGVFTGGTVRQVRNT